MGRPPRQVETVLRSVETACAEWSDDVVEASTRLQGRLEELRSVWARHVASRRVRPPGPTCESRAKLLQWAVEQGAKAPDIEVRAFGDQSGVYAKRSLAEGDLVVAIPTQLMLFARMPGDALSDFMVRSGLDEVSPTVALAVRLVFEASRGIASPFAAYIAALPATFDTPLAWAPASLALLAGASLRRAAGAKRTAARMFCELARAVFSSETGLRAALPDWCEWDDWVWAMGAVVTRQNAVPATDRTRLGLVPLWDSCNHAVDAPSSGFADGCIELRAGSYLGKDDQVFMRYGDRSDADLVLHSGFCLGHQNPHDVAQLAVRLPPAHNLGKLVARVIDNAKLPRVSLSVWRGDLRRADHNSVVPDANLAALALACAATDKARVAHLMRTSNDGWSPMDADHARDADRFIADLIDAEVADRVAFRALRRSDEQHSRHDRLASSLYDTELTMLHQAKTTSERTR